MPVRNQLSTSKYANPPARVANRCDFNELVKPCEGRARRVRGYAAPSGATGNGQRWKVARPPGLKQARTALTLVVPGSLQGMPQEDALPPCDADPVVTLALRVLGAISSSR